MKLSKHNEITILCTPNELRKIADSMDKHIYRFYNHADGKDVPSISEYESSEEGKNLWIVFKINEDMLPRDYVGKA